MHNCIVIYGPIGGLYNFAWAHDINFDENGRHFACLLSKDGASTIVFNIKIIVPSYFTKIVTNRYNEWNGNFCRQLLSHTEAESLTADIKSNAASIIQMRFRKYMNAKPSFQVKYNNWI